MTACRAQGTRRSVEHIQVDQDQPAAYDLAANGDRRAPERRFYSGDQLVGRTPIRLRRASDKRRLAMHLLLAVLLLSVAAWWVFVPPVFVSPVVLVFNQGHGVHLADLPALLFVAVAARSLLVARGVAFARV